MSTFTGNVNKLVSAAMLQDFLIDKDGTPMSGGTVTMYHDNSRTTLKNWYYQSGTPGNYTYITLPNPLTLSAAGTITDINGVDTLPFYYPWSETDENVADPYYVTIVNHNNTNQLTRANFPFSGSGSGPTPPLPPINIFNNLVINNSFWRNIQPNNVNTPSYASFSYTTGNMPIPPGGTLPSIIVAPGNHDGFRMPDIEFQKNTFVNSDSVTFTPFPLSNSQVIQSTVIPEYYISHTCSGAVAGETQKCYQFPLALHVNTLANATFTFSIDAQNDQLGSTSTGANVINIFILQDTGTGGAPSPSTLNPVPFFTITLNSTWQTYTTTSVFPGTLGLALGGGGDDALYLQVQMPLSIACKINFTAPSIYLGSSASAPLNNYQTYDQIDSIINDARTGDIRTSINSFYYFGWVPMNNGTIGNQLSNADAYGKVDAWPLFNLLWNTFVNYDNAGINLMAQMYTSANATVAYGASAISDWNANKAIALSPMMGRVMLGGAPYSALRGNYTSTFSAAANLLTTTNAVAYFNGMPVYFKNTANLSTKLIYYVANFNGVNQFNLASSFANAIVGTVLTFGPEAGTAIVASALQGSFEGEYAHTQSMAELVAHTHQIRTYSVAANSAQPMQSDQTTGQLLATTESTGGGKPFNVTQPGTFYNMFIKL